MEEYKKWLKIRNIITGYDNGSTETLYELASNCTHPKAVWFLNLFKDKTRPTSNFELYLFFKKLENDEDAQLFVDPNVHTIERYALNGNSYAQSLLARRLYAMEKFDDCLKWAKLSGNEPSGLSCIAMVLQKRNDHDFIKYYEKAAELDHVYSITALYDVFKYKDLSKATTYAIQYYKITGSVTYFVNFINTYSGNNLNILFRIGEVIDYDPGTQCLINCKNVYNSTIEKVRKAIHTWSLFANRCLRNYVNKDIRLKIGKILWDLRISWTGQKQIIDFFVKKRR